MALTAGSMLSDNLMLTRELGHGAMGQVWLAKNLALDSEVAVKVLLGAGAGAETRARFEQEARGVAQLDHPHVVKVFDYGMTPDGEPYIVMELLRGEDLRQRVQRRGVLSLPETVTIVSQAARALGRAHALGIIHRDIKPANLFLLEAEGDIFVKVLDFGVAKFAGGGAMDMTRTGVAVGTPAFMSPEQLLDPKRIDLRSDLWALAVVAYACLTGQAPFTGETVAALAVSVMSGVFSPPTQRRADLPASVDAWMRRALQVDPDHRYPSAAELAEALAAAAGVAPSFIATTQPPPVAAVTAPPAPVRRKASRAPLVALVVVACGGAAGGGLWLAQRLRPAELAKTTAPSKKKKKKPKKAAPSATETVAPAPSAVPPPPAAPSAAPPPPAPSPAAPAPAPPPPVTPQKPTPPPAPPAPPPQSGDKIGSRCQKGSQCASGFCADGVCCDAPCTARCQTCLSAKKQTGNNGYCGYIPAGGDPDGECPGAQTCDGLGLCM